MLESFLSAAAVLKLLPVIVSILGVVVGSQIKPIAEKATRLKRTSISKEAGENFILLVDGKPVANTIGSLWRAADSDHSHDGAVIGPEPTITSAELAKRQVRLRLQEIIEERERQENIAKWSIRTSYFLTGGQFIVGAALTSSLAQDRLSKAWIGIFGLIVILCSAAKQHFHVDENAQAAASFAKRLRALIRNAQDQVAILEATSTKGEDRTDSFIALMNRLTSTFNEVEATGDYSRQLSPQDAPAAKSIDNSRPAEK